MFSGLEDVPARQFKPNTNTLGACFMLVTGNIEDALVEFERDHNVF